MDSKGVFIVRCKHCGFYYTQPMPFWWSMPHNLKMLKEIRRILNPRGVAYITVTNEWRKYGIKEVGISLIPNIVYYPIYALGERTGKGIAIEAVVGPNLNQPAFGKARNLLIENEDC